MQTKYLIEHEKDLDSIDIRIVPGDRIFFYGDLGAGKTTLIRHLLRKYTHNPSLIVRSPTYTYYEKYVQIVSKSYPTIGLPKHISIFHFDLYRLDSVDTFYSIGGMEIAEDPCSIMLIEWPEILGNLIQPTKKISIQILEDGIREIGVEQ